MLAALAALVRAQYRARIISAKELALMKSILAWSGIVLFAVSCSAQKNEVDMMLGNTWSFKTNTTFAIPGFSHTLTSGRDSNFTYEIGVARKLASFRPGNLSLELTAAGFPAHSSTDFASVFVTPAAKFSFLPQNRVSPFVSTGVGFVHLSRGGRGSTNAAAYQFGGGADVKTPIRFVSIRGEGRDFLASQSGFSSLSNPPHNLTATGSFRNHVLLGGGPVFRF